MEKLNELSKELVLASNRVAKREKQITSEVAHLIEKNKADQELATKIKEQIKEAYELALEQGVLVDKKWEDEYIKITYVAPTKRPGVDTTKLRNSYPDVYEDCKKESSVKGYIKIAPKTDTLRLA